MLRIRGAFLGIVTFLYSFSLRHDYELSGGVVNSILIVLLCCKDNNVVLKHDQVGFLCSFQVFI